MSLLPIAWDYDAKTSARFFISPSLPVQNNVPHLLRNLLCFNSIYVYLHIKHITYLSLRFSTPVTSYEVHRQDSSAEVTAAVFLSADKTRMCAARRARWSAPGCSQCEPADTAGLSRDSADFDQRQ